MWAWDTNVRPLGCLPLLQCGKAPKGALDKGGKVPWAQSKMEIGWFVL